MNERQAELPPDAMIEGWRFADSWEHGPTERTYYEFEWAGRHLRLAVRWQEMPRVDYQADDLTTVMLIAGGNRPARPSKERADAALKEMLTWMIRGHEHNRTREKAALRDEP